VLAAVPVALFTFLVLQWSIASGRMRKFSAEEDLRRQHKKHARSVKKARRKRAADPDNEDTPLFHQRAAGDFFHNKVMSFGGGYYGTMAVLTYILIELVEIWQFLVGILSPSTWIDKLGLDLLIEFFINSLTNLIAAFLWFATLPEYITINNGFVWLAASYLGYLAGMRLTTVLGDRIWARMLACYEGAVQRLRSRF
jgi:hypothetical protein